MALAKKGWPTEDQWQELRVREAACQPFRMCSGQRANKRSKRDWGVCCDDSGVLPLWWRLEDSRGRRLTYETPLEALRALEKVNPLAEVYRYARGQTDKLKEYYVAADARGWDARGWDAWEGVNRYGGVRCSLWGSDPFGLFTADLIRPFNRWDCPQWRAERAAREAA